MNLIKTLWSKRERQSNKGQNGKVLIIGGCEDYIGALALAGLAALRSGADLVKIAAPEKVAWAINSMTPDLITIKFRGKHFSTKHVKKVLKEAEWADAVLIGNGIGLKSAGFVRAVVRRIRKPMVIDADAIKALKEVNHAILTPHKKEFEIFSGRKLSKDFRENIQRVKEVAGDNVILLKGQVDIIASALRYKINRTGNPGMTKGGTGDVLAGICVGLLAQGMDRFNAAYVAAKINGKLGDLLKKKKGYAFLASELIEDIKNLKRYKC